MKIRIVFLAGGRMYRDAWLKGRREIVGFCRKQWPDMPLPRNLRDIVQEIAERDPQGIYVSRY